MLLGDAPDHIETGKQRWGRKEVKQGDVPSCYSVAVPVAEGWTGEIYAATTWFLSVHHQVVLSSKRNSYGLSWCFAQAFNITLPPHILEQ